MQNGSGTITHTGSTIATISTSDRAVIVWNGANDNVAAGQFFVAGGQVYNFQMPAGGAVLNRITPGGPGWGATIAGQLDSNGKVFVLAPGGSITLASGATVTATGGLHLSTIAEENGAFLATGDLLYSGVAGGSITIGTGALAANVGGNLTAVGGSVVHNSSSVTGEMVVKSMTLGAPMGLTSTPAGELVVGGNLTLQTNAGDITQTLGGGAVKVGSPSGAAVGTQVATLNTQGNNSISLNNVLNDFQNVAITAGTGGAGNVIISDANIIRLNASTIGGNLQVNAVGDTRNLLNFLDIQDVAIATNGTINVMGNADFNTTNVGGANITSRVNIAHNSTVGGILSGSIGNNGSFTFNGTGNVTTGTITSTNGVSGAGRSAITINTTGNLTVNGPMTVLGNNATVGANITLTGATINHAAGVLKAGNNSRGGGITMNATAGNLTVGNLDSYNRIALTAGAGSISQVVGTTIITRNNSSSSPITNVINAPNGTVVLDNANTFAGNNIFQVNATTANITSGSTMVLGTTNVTGNLNLVSTGGDITLGTGLGTGGQAITVGNVLQATVGGAGQILDGDYSPVTVLGGMNLVTAGGNIVLNAATANGVFAPAVRYGVVSANAGVGSVTISETTALNLGNVTASSLTASSVQGGIVDSGAFTITGTVSLVVGGNNTIVFDNAGHNINTLNVSGTGSANIMVAAPVTLGTGANILTGDLTVTSAAAQNITLGASMVAGNVTLNAGGIIDLVGVISVNGNASFNALTNTTITATTGGLLSDYLPAVTASRNSTATVGVPPVANPLFDTVSAITVNSSRAAGNAAYLPDILSLAGAGTLTIAGTGAGATGTLTLGAHGQITGATLTSIGAGYTATPTVSISVPVTTSITQSAGTLAVKGNLSLGSGAILDKANDVAALVLNNTTGNVLLNDINDLSISGKSAGRVVAIAGGNSPTALAPMANTWNASLGNLDVAGLSVYALNGGGGNSGTITQQSGTAVRSSGLTQFTTINNNIVLSNSGNNFGRVELRVTSTDGSRTVNVSEDGTMRLGVLNSRGTSTLVSRTGSIIEDPDANTTVTNNGTLVATANSGSILIGNTTRAAGSPLTTTGNLVTANLTAPTGAAAVQSSANITLGNTNVNSLVVTSGNNILQSAAVRVFGTANFTATNNITLTNTGNNFGRVSLATTNTTAAPTNGLFRDISIVESGTLNLGTVSMPANTTGNFTARSVNGDIIDTGLAGFKPGGVGVGQPSALVW
jgi:alkylated DNA nucleotide flippase Atl1